MPSESSDSSSLGSGGGPSGIMISSSLSSSLSSSSSSSSTGARYNVNLRSHEHSSLTSLLVRHTGGWHSEWIVHRIKVDTPRWVSQLPIFVIKVRHVLISLAIASGPSLAMLSEDLVACFWVFGYEFFFHFCDIAQFGFEVGESSFSSSIERFACSLLQLGLLSPIILVVDRSCSLCFICRISLSISASGIRLLIAPRNITRNVPLVSLFTVCVSRVFFRPSLFWCTASIRRYSIAHEEDTFFSSFALCCLPEPMISLVQV